MRIAPKVNVTAKERKTLEVMAHGRRTSVRMVERAKIVWAAAAGKENREIAIELGVTRGTVARWRNRFVTDRIAGIEKDLPRAGRTPTRMQLVSTSILETTLHEKPAAATHWTVRTLAKRLSISHSLVHRVWKIHHIQPHLIKTFKVSNDPRFVEKVVDIVGLYLNPPEKALVFSVVSVR